MDPQYPSISHLGQYIKMWHHINCSAKFYLFKKNHNLYQASIANAMHIDIDWWRHTFVWEMFWCKLDNFMITSNVLLGQYKTSLPVTYLQKILLITADKWRTHCNFPWLCCVVTNASYLILIKIKNLFPYILSKISL